MYLENITPIEIEWNRWNGFFFHLLKINDHSLFGIGFGWNSFFYIHLLYFEFIIEKESDKHSEDETPF